MTDAIDALISGAQNAAGQIADGPSNLPAVASNSNNAVATHQPAGAAAAMTLEDLAAGSMSVDAYLKVSYYGFTVGDDPTLFKSAKVKIRPEEVFPHKSIRITVANKTTYFRSANGQTELRSGKPWAQVKADAAKADPKCTGDYDAADVPFTLLEDLKDASGKVILEAGKRVGYTTSITGMKPFRDFTKKVLLKYDRDTDIVGEIGHFAKFENGNKWGFLTFGEPESWQSAEALANAA